MIVEPSSSHHNRFFVGNPASFISIVAQWKDSSTCNKEYENLTSSQNLAQSLQSFVLYDHCCQEVWWSRGEMVVPSINCSYRPQNCSSESEIQQMALQFWKGPYGGSNQLFMKNGYDHHDHQDIYTYNLSVPERFTLDVPNQSPP